MWTLLLTSDGSAAGVAESTWPSGRSLENASRARRVKIGLHLRHAERAA
jgi:hypothetical protein